MPGTMGAVKTKDKISSLIEFNLLIVQWGVGLTMMTEILLTIMPHDKHYRRGIYHVLLWNAMQQL